MKIYITYDLITGRIISRKRLARGHPLPKQGPLNLPGMEGLAILHCDACLKEDRVEHGKVVPKGKQQKLKEQNHQDWMAFRQLRHKMLSETDFMLTSDYPLTKAERNGIKAKRKASRDLPQKTKNPKKALQMLRTIWELDK